MSAKEAVTQLADLMETLNRTKVVMYLSTKGLIKVCDDDVVCKTS